jgi:hypothetical protein
MRRGMLGLFVLLAVAFASFAEDVARDERLFRVKYSDGSVEKYRVRWDAVAEFSTREEGGPAKPLEGKLFDDRRCYWSSNGRIERRVFLLNRAGKEFENRDKYLAYNTDFQNEGSSFLITGFRSENCNDSQARRESDFNNTRNHLRQALPGMVDADFKKVLADYRQDAETVVEVLTK